VFRGVANLNLDSKGRIAMPTRHREPLMELCGGRMVVTVDPDRCLLIYPFPEWVEIERKLNRLSNLNPRTRDLQRLLVGHATESDMDGQGRMLVAPALRRFADLEKKVVLIGQFNKFELWDEARWEAKCEAWRSGEGLTGEGLPEDLANLSL